MNLETIPAAIGDKSVLRQLIELYQYDLSEFSPDLDVEAHVLHGYNYLGPETWGGPAQYFDNRRET